MNILARSGTLVPIIIPATHTGGTGLMNPSIYLDGDNLILNLRHVNYTFYHSERKLFQHIYGPLTYVHPENDIKLRTTNWLLHLNEDLSIRSYKKIDSSALDKAPLWEFVGLEDARLFRWEDCLYLSGVRRDTTTNGEGRMELSSILDAVETSRVRIEPPKHSYCEKNWMPILDKPYHYVKWSNPTEVVRVDPSAGTSETVVLSQPKVIGVDLRGGSQVLPFKGGYLAITHEVSLFNSPVGRKDAIYRHRFVHWDDAFNIVKISEPFSFMGADVEFCAGACIYGDNLLISFGYQDNAAYILKLPLTTLTEYLHDI